MAELNNDDTFLSASVLFEVSSLSKRLMKSVFTSSEQSTYNGSNYVAKVGIVLTGVENKLKAMLLDSPSVGDAALANQLL